MRIDLRSDTVTLPTEEMRRVIAAAEVGDDMYGEDPTVRALEEHVSQLLGKERALFVPTGTMANQIALALHTQAGDAVLAARASHCVTHESGAGAALSGVSFIEVGDHGLPSVADLEQAWYSPIYYKPNISLLWLENTHNASGGTPVPAALTEDLERHARDLELAVHVDGARLWNAAAALGTSPAELAAPADTVSVCFSKGLGAPVGSALAVPDRLYERARRLRKMFGGAMRQSGVLAAAARYALERHLNRIAEDHVRAKTLADAIGRMAGATLVAPAQTNMVMVRLRHASAPAVAKKCAARGLLLNAVSGTTVRLVTHLGISDSDIEQAEKILFEVIADPGRSAA